MWREEKEKGNWFFSDFKHDITLPEPLWSDGRGVQRPTTYVDEKEGGWEQRPQIKSTSFVGSDPSRCDSVLDLCPVPNEKKETKIVNITQRRRTTDESDSAIKRNRRYCFMGPDPPNLLSFNKKVLRSPIFWIYFHKPPYQRRVRREEPNNWFSVSVGDKHGPKIREKEVPVDSIT